MSPTWGHLGVVEAFLSGPSGRTPTLPHPVTTPECHVAVATQHLHSCQCPASVLLGQYGSRGLSQCPLMSRTGDSQGWGPGKGAHTYLGHWDCTCLLQQHSHQAGDQEEPVGPERGCEVGKGLPSISLSHPNPCRTQMEADGVVASILARRLSWDGSLKSLQTAYVPHLTEKDLQAGEACEMSMV